MRNLKLISHREASLFTPLSSTDNDAAVKTRAWLSLDFDAGLTFVAFGRCILAIGDGSSQQQQQQSGGNDAEGTGSRVRWRVELMLKEDDKIVGIHWSLENEALVVATAGEKEGRGVRAALA